MLSLPDVTLCCIDTRQADMALDAMKTCMSRIAFGRAILITAPGQGLREIPSGIEVVETDAIHSIEDYSRFLIKSLRPCVHTSHVLIIQWDGYVVDPGMWDSRFLEMDYIGAVWPQFKDVHRVGNGGFSLRSRRLLDALADDAIQPSHPEDVCIARTYRTLLEQRWHIRFADEVMAHRFAFERERACPSSFGFHGLSNMGLLLSEAELEAFMRRAPASLFASVEARGFIKHLLRRRLKPQARQALSARLARRGWSLAELRLWLRYWMTRG